MSDKLEWRNNHAVLLRAKEWAPLAQRENYAIRADLRPFFEAHPISEDLLAALHSAGLYREGCEFLARNLHRRAAVWWGYCCLLSLFEERRAVASGAMTPTSPEAELHLAEVKPLLEASGIDTTALFDEKADPKSFCKMPHVDFAKLLADYVPPPQDNAAIGAASAALKRKTDALEALLPPEIGAIYGASREKVVASFVANRGMTPESAFDAVREAAKGKFVTYAVRRADSPYLKPALALQDSLEKMRQGLVASVMGALPDQFPVAPEATKLLKAESDKVSADAVQAVWRWIVAPDERNTTLALAAGNAAAQFPEGLLAYSAAWSYGDLTPEGGECIPVPPELPGTGLNSALLAMAIGEGGYRRMSERYEHYFILGLDVARARNLWPNAASEELSPQERLAAEAPVAPKLAAAPKPAVPATPVSTYRKWTR